VLHLSLLGRAEIRLDDALLRDRLPLKGLALLAYLAVVGEPGSREALAGLLWGETPEEQARASLRVTLNRLPAALRPFLVATPQAVELRQERVSLDVRALEAAARLSDPVAWQAAVADYRGDFLQGLSVPDSPAFEEWALLERERLRLMVIDLLHRLTEDALSRGTYGAGIGFARRILALDNWREEAHRLLMRLLALDGRRSDALAQFEQCRRLLAENLGVEPAGETVALYETIRADAIIPGEGAPGPSLVSLTQPPTIPATHNLPATATTFVGRKAELAQLAELLARPDGRLLTILGPGGVGKTRLALETASGHLSDPRFADGIYLVPLADVPPHAGIASAVAEVLGLKLSSVRPPEQQIAAHLRDQRLLLLLDSLEHLVTQAEQLASWLAGAPGLRLLVTSRERLGLYEEWLVELGGLDAPPAAASDWADYSAAQLFIQRARRVYLGFESAAERESIVRICELVGGLPLALEMAAAWVRTVSCREISGAIEEGLNVLESDLRNVPERQRSLAATFAYSYALLAEPEQRALARLAVFRGGFDGGAAAEIAGAGPRQLSALVDKSLLQREATGRFLMHEAIRQFAQQRAGDVEWAQFRAGHARYYADYVAAQGSKSAGPEAEAAFTRMALELENARLAWQWALEQWPDTEPMFNQLLPHLSLFYLRRGRSPEAITWLGEAQAVATGGRLATRLQYQQAKHEEVMGRYADTRTRLLACLPALEADPELALDAADGWEILGRAQRHLGDPAAAESFYRRSLDLHRQLSKPSRTAGVLLSLGILAKDAGRYAEAAGYYRESLQFFRRQDDRAGVMSCLINLGNIANVQGEYEQARASYQESYELAITAENRPNIAISLLNLGSVARATGDASAAEQYYAQSLGLGREMGRDLIVAASLDGLGQTRLLAGDFAGARAALREGLETAVALQSATMTLTILASAGRALAGEPEGAELLALALGHENTPHYVKEEITAFAASRDLDVAEGAGRSLDEGVALALAGLGS